MWLRFGLGWEREKYLRSRTKSKHFQWLKLFLYCSLFWVPDISPKTFSLRNTHRKSGYKTLFLYSEKYNNWQIITGEKFRRGHKFRLTLEKNYTVVCGFHDIYVPITVVAFWTLRSWKFCPYTADFPVTIVWKSCLCNRLPMKAGLPKIKNSISETSKTLEIDILLYYKSQFKAILVYSTAGVFYYYGIVCDIKCAYYPPCYFYFLKFYPSTYEGNGLKQCLYDSGGRPTQISFNLL